MVSGLLLLIQPRAGGAVAAAAGARSALPPLPGVLGLIYDAEIMAGKLSAYYIIIN